VKVPKKTISDQITGLDGGIILAKPGGADQRSAFSAYSPFSITSASTLTERDIRSIIELQNTDAVAPLMFINGTVKYKGEQVKGTPIIATTPDFVSLLKLSMASGSIRQ
jgi:hypothetical protein